MKIYLRLVFVAAVFICLFHAATLAQEPIPAPDFKLEDIQGNSVSLSSYQDKHSVLLLFWTTWCPFCRDELKILNRRYADFLKEGLEVLAINVGESRAKVENFIKRYNLSYSVVLDKDTRAARSYAIFGVPTYVLVDKKGYLVFQDNYFPYTEYKELILK